MVMALGKHTPHPSAGLRLVVGLGVSGRSSLTWLTRRGFSVRVTDSREAPPELAAARRLDPRPELRLGALDPASLDGVAEVVVSPGVALDEPLIREAVARGIPVVGDIELFARAAARPVLAVTGSNGKSTVTTLLARMAAAAGRRVLAGGNLGPPALDLLAEPVPDLYVLELSSFQLEVTASLRPRAAVVLNLSPDHMDRHGSMEQYAAAKGRIYTGAGVVVANRDDPVAQALAPRGRPALTFGLGPADGPRDFGLLVNGEGETWLCRGDEALLDTADIPLPGAHNRANVLAALAMGHAAGLPMAAMLEAVGQFPGLPHRMCLAHRAGDVDWIDDSKATNVGAAAAALSGMDRPVVLIAGGDAKGADLGPLAEAARGRIKAAVLIGRDAARLETALAGLAPVVRRSTLENAVETAAGLAMPGDVVLLSPACASTDMFANYRERGETFARLARAVTP